MRLNLRLSGSAERLILDISESLGVTPKEVILDSLALYQLAVSEMKKEGRLGIKSKEGDFMAIGTPTLRALAEEESPGTKHTAHAGV